MRTVAVQGNGVKYSFEGVGADGTPAGADAVTLKRVHAQKIAGTLLKGGKEVGKVTAEVSKDGKVATVKTKGKTVDGKEYSTESVYDKQ